MPLPPYVRKRGGQFLFRQAVPDALRQVIGKTEIKKSLGPDRDKACSQAKSLAVEVDKLFNDARAHLARHAQTVASRALPKQIIERVTPELRAQLKAHWLAIVDTADVQRRATFFAHIEQDEVARQSAEVSSIFRRALATGDVSPVLKPMHEVLYFAGYELAPSLVATNAERELAIDYARAVLQGNRLLDARDVGDDLPLPTISPLPHLEAVTSAQEGQVPIRISGPGAGLPLRAEVPTATEELKLSTVIEAFLASWKGRAPMKVKLVATLSLFLTFVGDKPIAQLKQLDINRFFDFLQELPPRWKDECRRRRLTVVELARIGHPVTLAPKTFEDTYLAAFRLFLTECKRTWQDMGFPTTLTTDGIRYSGKMKAGMNKQRAFTQPELRTVFEGKSLLRLSQNEDELHMFWLPVLSLHTGARINEICQLNPQCDVFSVSGILVLNITDETAAAKYVEKSVKNTSSKRIIPVHKKLLELGFAEYVAALKQAGAQQLFPAWRPYKGKAGANAGKWHSRWLQSHDINLEERRDGRTIRGAHAYRHTLLTYGGRAGLMLWPVSGHSNSMGKEADKDNPVALGYEDAEIMYPLEEKQRTLNSLDYGLKIPKPVPLSIETARKIVFRANQEAV